MKKVLFILMAFSLAIVSCKKDDDSSLNTTTTAVTNTVTSGAWRVTNYNEKGTDRTSVFNGYAFIFASSGSTTATLGGTAAITGSWKTGTDNSKVKLIITFTSTANSGYFVEISEDWEVLERTDTKIRLRHISGGNGTTDLLTFEKN